VYIEGPGGVIDPRAIVDPRASLAEDVTVEPYAIIGPEVAIAQGTWIGSHALISGPTRIGRNNKIHPFAAIGGNPQDKKYGDESTLLEIGDRNIIREYCTLNRGTVQGGGITRIGHDNWIMAYVHIAHDCQVGSGTVFANGASLAGHVTVQDYVTLGGFTLVSQFCRIGAYSFTAMGSLINRDVPPYVIVSGPKAEPRGINAVGLRRQGFTPEQIRCLREVYKILYLSDLRLSVALKRLEVLAAEHPVVSRLTAFIEESGTRSIVR
jgi:acyl-[acyl-carrier-protein]--UDP-N-acetylglucosamine O-acyltransferase